MLWMLADALDADAVDATWAGVIAKVTLSKRAWDAAPAISFQACADKCDEEEDCKYFSFDKKHACTGFRQLADKCESRHHTRTSEHPYICYAKK